MMMKHIYIYLYPSFQILSHHCLWYLHSVTSDVHVTDVAVLPVECHNDRIHKDFFMNHIET